MSTCERTVLILNGTPQTSAANVPFLTQHNHNDRAQVECQEQDSSLHALRLEDEYQFRTQMSNRNKEAADIQFRRRT